MPGHHPSDVCRAVGLAMAALAGVGLLLCAACKRKPAAAPAAQTTVDELLLPQKIVEALTHRKGAQVKAKTEFHVAVPRGQSVAGAQDIVTIAEVLLDPHGHYSLQEENDQDGGRSVYFNGEDIAVKLRYGKVIKRSGRGAEATEILEQALGGPWAAWELLASNSTFTAAPAASDGTITLTLALGHSKRAGGSQSPHRLPDGLSSWRKTAVPKDVKGTLRYLPGGENLPATLVAAEISGSFSADVEKAGGIHQVQGQVQIQLQTEGIGQTAALPIPEDADQAWTRQRTILEERALLGEGPATKSNLPP